MRDILDHPIRLAALKAGLLDARPASAEPFSQWKAVIDSLPYARFVNLHHQPEAVSGWPASECTVWSALYSVPDLNPWPSGCLEVGNSFYRAFEMRPVIARWHQSVRDLGIEIVPDPSLPDRAAAVRAGLGVYGLSGPLIAPGHGSRVCLVTLIARQPPPEGTPVGDAPEIPFCSRCGQCARACPAGAIGHSGLDAAKCLRHDMYHPDDIPEAHFGLMHSAIGCEVCQRACPHNQKLSPDAPSEAQAAPLRIERLLDGPDLGALSKQLEAPYLSDRGLRMQAILAAANSRRFDLIPRIVPYQTCDDPALARAANWALEQLRDEAMEE